MKTENKTFVIEYKIYFSNKSPTIHTTKVKNCMGELHAKIKLGEWLKKKHSDFKNLEIISCKEDIVGMFGDIFGKDNPFDFFK